MSPSNAGELVDELAIHGIVYINKSDDDDVNKVVYSVVVDQ
jgi:hypothetical protein